MSATQQSTDARTWPSPGTTPFVAADGPVEFPVFPVRPFAYYRVEIAARTAESAYWSAEFYDDSGERIYSDNCSQLPASGDWRTETSVFMARTRAATARIRIWERPEPVEIRHASVAPITKQQASTWCDSFLQAIPESNTWKPPTDRWRHLAGTRKRLQQGGPLRMVVLGDSVANDMVNGHPQLLIDRAWRGAQVRMFHSMEREKGCSGYQHNSLVEPYVLRYQPDLFVIAGMSFGGDPEPAINVIHQVRARAPELETIVAVASVTDLGHNDPESLARFYAELRTVGDREGFAVFDIRNPWRDYVEASGRPTEWFTRDTHHANDRGKQLMARLFASHFTP